MSLILTADPNFQTLALDELKKALTARYSALRKLDEGVWLMEGVSFWEVGERWRKQPPIFVHHICPAQVIVPFSDAAALTQTIATELLGYIDPTQPFSVQTRVLGDNSIKPFDVNKGVAEMIAAATSAPLDVRQPEQILSIVIAGGNAYLGVSWVGHNLSDWAGGVHRFARREGQISRAEFKLLEALAVFKITLPERGRALDLGAAPGGWTAILRQKGFTVVAVDPAELHPSLKKDPGVQHRRLTAETYLETLSTQPSALSTFAVIVNDMRQDARDSARLMVAYRPYLADDGLALMSFKLPEQKPLGIVEQGLAILRDAYVIAGARQLFHNRQEITVYLRGR
ncbi:MAG: methyltransferase domain-containing protein [Chloroflexi bacterium]|nr:methyltransferase domain-containing protein [Chloroflexota bacterium]